MSEIKKKKIKKVLASSAIIWRCASCNAYNLHPLEWEDFNCINCEAVFYAQAHENYVWRPKP